MIFLQKPVSGLNMDSKIRVLTITKEAMGVITNNKIIKHHPLKHKIQMDTRKLRVHPAPIHNMIKLNSTET